MQTHRHTDTQTHTHTYTQTHTQAHTYADACAYAHTPARPCTRAHPHARRATPQSQKFAWEPSEEALCWQHGEAWKREIAMTQSATPKSITDPPTAVVMSNACNFIWAALASWWRWRLGTVLMCTWYLLTIHYPYRQREGGGKDSESSREWANLEKTFSSVCVEENARNEA